MSSAIARYQTLTAGSMKRVPRNQRHRDWSRGGRRRRVTAPIYREPNALLPAVTGDQAGQDHPQG